jgi:hypothetical protein
VSERERGVREIEKEREEWERERERKCRACAIKHFTSVIDSSTVSYSHPSLIFTDKGGAYSAQRIGS